MPCRYVHNEPQSNVSSVAVYHGFLFLSSKTHKNISICSCEAKILLTSYLHCVILRLEDTLSGFATGVGGRAFAMTRLRSIFFCVQIAILTTNTLPPGGVLNERRIRLNNCMNILLTTVKFFRKTLPIEHEERMIRERMAYNGGRNGYIDNIYPCGIFSKKQLYEINFDAVTILYGGNGSGKSTLLNLIANKLRLNRIAPFNSSELFDEYTFQCDYELSYDDEGFPLRIPNGSRIITSDDIFDYMLTVRTNNLDIAENIELARDVSLSS